MQIGSRAGIDSTRRSGSRPTHLAVRSRPGSVRTAWVCVLALCVLAGLVAMLAVAARAVTADSDGASLVLEGQTIVHGHLLLQGWALSLDSFWTSEVPLYALGYLAAGVSPALLTVVPAVLYALAVAFGVGCAAMGLRGRAARASCLATFVLLAFPTWAMTLFVLRGGHHMGAVICSLAAFMSLCFGGRRYGPAVATALLLVGMLGDLQTAAYGVLPVIAAGVLASLRTRSWRGGAVPVAVGATAGVLFVVGRELSKALGAFSSGSANAVAHTPHQLIANLRHLYSLGGELLGLKASVFGTDSTPTWLHAAHVLAGIVVVVCCILAGLRVAAAAVWGAPRRPTLDGGRPARTSAMQWRMDEMLIMAALGSAGSFVVLAYVNSTAFARYLAPTVVFMAVLTGRVVGPLVAAVRARRGRWAVGAVALVVAACLVGGFAYRTSLAKPPQTATALSGWLRGHGLTSGVGAYWSSSIVTVVSHGRVRVRPVVPNQDGRLVRYDRESDARWYAGREFDFVVFQPGAASAGVSLADASRTWGPPAHQYTVDGYQVAVWAHPFRVPAAHGYGS